MIMPFFCWGRSRREGKSFFKTKGCWPLSAMVVFKVHFLNGHWKFVYVLNILFLSEGKNLKANINLTTSWQISWNLILKCVVSLRNHLLNFSLVSKSQLAARKVQMNESSKLFLIFCGKHFLLLKPLMKGIHYRIDFSLLWGRKNNDMKKIW